MCISIQIKFRTAVVLGVFASLAFGTWLWHSVALTNNIDRASMERITCNIVSSSPVVENDIKTWHNNWSYNFENQTYSFTNNTPWHARSIGCCVVISDPCNVVKCVKDNSFNNNAYLILGWFVGICILGMVWSCRDKPPRPIVQLHSNDRVNI
jgi:hypothetical protein